MISLKTTQYALVRGLGVPVLALSVLTLSACVTINIYFPAAEAQKAADKIIDDVWQLKKATGATVNVPSPDKGTAPTTTTTPAN